MIAGPQIRRGLCCLSVWCILGTPFTFPVLCFGVKLAQAIVESGGNNGSGDVKDRLGGNNYKFSVLNEMIIKSESCVNS